MNPFNLLDIITGVVAAFLASISVFLIVIEICARFDRRNIVFSATNVILCAFCIIDIWFQPDHLILSWTKAQLILVGFFPPMFYWCFALLNGKVKKAILGCLFSMGAAFLALITFFPVLKVFKGDVITTRLFNFTYVPYILLMIAGMVGFAVAVACRPKSSQRRIKVIYCLGLLIICLCGVFDLIMLIKGNTYLENSPEWPDWYVWGILLFVMATTYIFIEQLYRTVRERRETLTNLIAAYRELDQAQALKEIGQSATIINHEIRNFMFAIGSNARLLGKEDVPAEKRKRYAGNICETVSHLTAFSNEVIELSKSKIIADKKPHHLADLARASVHKNFRDVSAAIVFDEQPDSGTVIGADEAKIEHVFVNIVRNALEAGADRIRIAMSASEQVVLCTVEDNGTGCAPEQLKNLFRAFYTTKKEKGGTGLGLSLVRSIMQSHGGAISVYSKNGIAESETGLIFCLSFARYAANSYFNFEVQDPVVIVKEGLPDLDPVLHVFANVQVNPRVATNIHQVEGKLLTSAGLTICAASPPLPRLTGHRFFELHQSPNSHYLIKSPDTGPFPQLLTEEYILKHILGQPAQAG